MPLWVAQILSTAATVVLGWFGYVPKAAGPSADQKVGKLEAENEGLKNYVDVADRAGAARDRVVDDPHVVYNDPDNRRER